MYGSADVAHGKEEGSDKCATDEDTRREDDLPSKVGVLLGVGLQVTKFPQEYAEVREVLQRGLVAYHSQRKLVMLTR